MVMSYADVGRSNKALQCPSLSSIFRIIEQLQESVNKQKIKISLLVVITNQ